MSSTPTQTAAQPAANAEKRAYREGYKLGAPTLPGIFAWGVVTGVAMVKAGLSMWQAIGMSFFVYAGSAQLSVLPLIAAHVPVLLIFATALVVNLRFVIFAAVIGPHFSHLSWGRRLWYGYFNMDVVIALFPRRFPSEDLSCREGKLGFFCGIVYPNWWAWQCGTAIGAVLAGQIVQSWGIGFAGTLALLALTIPLIVNSAALTGVLVSGAVAVASIHMPYRLGLLLAIVAGMLAAMMADWATDKEREGA